MMRFARSHCSFKYNYRGNEHLQQFGISIYMAVVDARIFPTPTINSVLSIIKGASVPAERWCMKFTSFHFWFTNLLIHVNILNIPIRDLPYYVQIPIGNVEEPLK
ncbi:unnamed protein product [Rhizophagus irregularis]|nr:unnamed protein product [Rhizophagus irregularis]